MERFVFIFTQLQVTPGGEGVCDSGGNSTTITTFDTSQTKVFERAL